MTNTTDLPTRTFYTDPNTGEGISAMILGTDDDGTYLIKVGGGAAFYVTAGDLYREDESGRYLGGPA